MQPFYYVGSGTRTDTAAAGTNVATRITLNPQLPPDVAQQRVNPLSLPTGQNGLFRLSGQAGNVTQVAQAQATLSSGTTFTNSNASTFYYVSISTLEALLGIVTCEEMLAGIDKGMLAANQRLAVTELESAIARYHRGERLDYD